jgi:bacterioferritin
MIGRLNRFPSDESGDTDVTGVDRSTLLAGLNHDLAGEYHAVLMYTTYAAKLTGPYRRELRALFLQEIGDEQAHAQFLADKIAALGGEPTTVPRDVTYAEQPREMLELVLAAEIQAVMDYGERIRQAEDYGDIGLKVALENQVADETRHKEEVERILSGWNDLNLERARNEDRWADDGAPG